MIKLVESTTTETLPSGMTLTTLHLTPEAKRGLSTNGAQIPPPLREPPAELAGPDHKMRHGAVLIALHLGTVAAVVLAYLGVQPVVCAMIPSLIVGLRSVAWALRDEQNRKRRRLARKPPDVALREFAAKVAEPPTSLLAMAHAPSRPYVEATCSEADSDAHDGKPFESLDQGQR